MKTKIIWILVMVTLFGVMVTTATAAETAWSDTFTDSSNISASENITVAGGDAKLATTTSSSPCICGSGTDHGGADWSPGTDVYGCHHNIGTCTINGATVKAYSSGSYGWLEIHANTINVAGSGLTGTGMGYPGGAPSTTYSGGNPGTGDGGTNNKVDGAGQGAHMSGGGGGGYGASGGAGGSMGSSGCGYGGAGGDAYGTSNTYQMKIGAGGAAGATTYAVGEYGGAGGAGGAGVLLNASSITINGPIRVNGSVGSVGESGYKGAGGGGAGAGGCIVVNAGTLSGSGSLYADGGDGGDAGDGTSHAYGGGGGGAGGRIKLWYTTSTFSGSNSMSSGSGGAGGTAPMGGGRDGCPGSTGTYLYTTPRQSSGGQEEYKPSGYLNSTAITPTSFESWDTFYATHSIPSGTNTTYRILNASDNSTLCEVNATEAAAGYSIPSGADSTTSIRLYAFLNTTNTSETSVLHDWNVSWTPKDSNPPASITNLANITGNFWINWTWDNPSDPDFNHTMVYIDDNPAPNRSESFYNDSYLAHVTKTISTHTVDTNGNVNSTWVNQTTTIPNNLPVLDPIGNKVINETETLAIDVNAADSDSDTLTYSCNRTIDLFIDFDPATGAGNWTPDYGDAGIYYVDFGASDGYGGIDNETIQITVNETEVTGNLLYFSPDTSTVPGYCCSVDVDVMARVNESNPVIATNVNITFDPGCINITNWVNNSGVWNGSTCTLWSVPLGYVHITTTVGENHAVNGTVRIGTLTIHCNNTTCCGTPLNFTSESMFIKEGSGVIYPARDNGSFLCGWYWKDYNGEAEGGYMPDFDQNQNFTDTPEIEENYCAPTAMANSLWWFDQKYPDRDVVSPGATPQQLIQELAWLMDTNGQRTGSPHNGTYVADEQAGIEEYLIQHGLTDLLYEHTELKPEFDWIEEEIERCQDVKLDLGFYQVLNVTELEPGQWEIEWKRIGGHAVTAAGVNSNCSQIAVSDPDADNAEFGLPGVVRGPNHNHGGVPFWDPAYNHTQHNDGVSASHDIYNVAPSISPGGIWELTDPYWRNTTVACRYAYNNGGQWLNITNYNGSSPPMVGDIRTEIEAAVVVSPKDCTPGIEVNKTVWDPVIDDWVEEITSQANISGCVRYRIRIQNNGTCCDLTNLVVNDTLPGFLTYNNSAIPFEPTDLGGNKYQWTFPTLNKSETKTIEFNATVSNTGNGTNEASATAWCAEFGVECSDGDGAYITAVACGDVDGNGAVNFADVGLLEYAVAGAPGCIIINEWASDVNCKDGVNFADVGLLRYAVAGAPGFTLGCCSCN